MTDDISNAEFASVSPTVNNSTEDAKDNLNRLYNLPITSTVQLGTAVMTIRDLITLTPGSVVELDKVAGESIDLFVNEVLIGKGEVVVVNDNFGLRITEIISSEERLKKI